jgi:radical SAM protein with 4Fe4S-binding SPASM domain
MIAYSREQGSVVNFPTNLTVGDKVIRKLVASGIEQIKVSVDATSGGTYILVRQSDRFEKVVRNIELVNAIKKEQGLTEPEIRLNYALQSYNLKELPDLMRFAKEHGVKTVYVQDLNYFSVEAEKSELCDFSKELLVETLDRAENLAKENGIDTNIVNWRRNMDSFYNKTLPANDFTPNDNYCSFPWVSVFIDVHGNVKPCPVFVWDKDAESSGNCLEQEFESIWNGEAYQQLRGEFKSNTRRHPICKNCVPPNVFDMRVIFQKMLIRR